MAYDDNGKRDDVMTGDDLRQAVAAIEGMMAPENRRTDVSPELQAAGDALERAWLAALGLPTDGATQVAFGVTDAAGNRGTVVARALMLFTHHAGLPYHALLLGAPTDTDVALVERAHALVAAKVAAGAPFSAFEGDLDDGAVAVPGAATP